VTDCECRSEVEGIDLNCPEDGISQAKRPCEENKVVFREESGGRLEAFEDAPDDTEEGQSDTTPEIAL
jgi:hypothetical protein